MTSARKAILTTLAYHDVFDYPMTHKEIYKFLCESFQFPISSFQFKNSLKDLEKNKKIFQKENFYFLPQRERTIDLRKKRKKYSQGKIKIAEEISKILSKIPFIQMIAITGALAMENSNKDDDIDFLIITSKNRLWLTRLLSAFMLEILGKRRRPKDKKFEDKICLNMFLDEFAISLPKMKHNLFTAHEIVQMKPLYNKQQTYEKFLKANKWVKNYLPNATKIKQLAIEQLGIQKKRKKVLNYYLLITQLLDSLEKSAYCFQLKYMESRRTTEKVSPHFAFFHPKDTGKEVLKKYKRKLNLT